MSNAYDAPIGAPCWVDVLSPDPHATVEFYTRLFGWSAEKPSEAHGGYVNFVKDGARIAGCIGPQQGENVLGSWTVYLAVADAKATVDESVARGAHVIAPAADVDDLGTMAVITDPGGAAIGLWQPGTHPGFRERGEDATPRWFELWTRDYERTVAFYRDVFGWSTQEMGGLPDFHYTIATHGDDRLAGIMDASAFLGDGIPSHWSVYFGVADADAAAETIRALGGSILRDPEDTPYGRLATATDSTGVTFKLMAFNEAMPGR